MALHQTKDASGVAVVQVEGQLIVGNRQELKDLVQRGPGRGRAPDPDRLLPHRLHRLLRARRAGLHLQAHPRRRRRAATVGTQRGSPVAVRAHQARYAVRHRRDAPASPRELLDPDRSDAVSAAPLRPPLPGPGRQRRGRAGDATVAERGRVHRGSRRAGHPPLPRRARRRPPTRGSGCRSSSAKRSATPSCAGTARIAASGWTSGPSSGRDAIRLEVTDEGPGFDPRAVPEPIRPEQLDEANGRGLYLIRKLVDAVKFNEQGNSICMILRRP